MKKIALIDGKNVTTDWVEEMFDSFECIKRNNEFLGYCMGNVLYAVYCANVITWEILDGMNKSLAVVALEERLKGRESEEQGIYSEITRHGYVLVQRFYFKED